MNSSTKIAFLHHSNFSDTIRDDVKIALRKIIPEVKELKHYYEIVHYDALCLLLENGNFELAEYNLSQLQKDTLKSAISNNIPVFIPYKPLNSMADGKWKFYKFDSYLYHSENVVAGKQGSYNDIYHIGPKTIPSQGITTSVQNRNILLLL